MAVIMEADREFARLLRAFSQITGFTEYALTGQSRKGPLVIARQALYAAARDMGYSMPRIGQLCGGRDHTTVLHGIRQHEARMERGK